MLLTIKLSKFRHSIQSPYTQFDSLASTVVKVVRTIDCNLLKLNTTFSKSLIYMAIETLVQGFSTLIFCPTRSMCESMANSIAANIFNIGQKDHVPQNDL
ncbi:hypothetical protein DERF_002897 [Dermatophagoides farinae]|uniref:Uncharacterized protein n=1 Tax=Dermatophagoides farinae TaxID=6954 RepID=A0A922LC95_DERFA|nr:hypothetical protein DERF_002897 [Dermatophagoides farinae]